jgi:hypothetical protein
MYNDVTDIGIKSFNAPRTEPLVEQINDFLGTSEADNEDKYLVLIDIAYGPNQYSAIVTYGWTTPVEIEVGDNQRIHTN